MVRYSILVITCLLLAAPFDDDGVAAPLDSLGDAIPPYISHPVTEEEALPDSLEGAAVPESAQGMGDPFPSGLNLEWMGAFSDNLRFTLDMSGRFEYDTALEDWSITQFYGLDLFKVLSDNRGDYATIVLQGFATRLDSSTDWQWKNRMIYINRKLVPRDVLNLKVGHFEMPFGLEMLIDTNGTLRQVDTGPNLGIKADWGLTLNGVSSGLEYEFGISRGSGNEWESAGSPSAIVGRVGTDPTKGWWVGLSGFAADLYQPGTTIERQRIGIDGGLDFGAVSLMGEVSGGSNESDDVVHMLGELNWRDPTETWFGYGQLRKKQGSSTTGWEGPFQSILGIERSPDRHWTLSAEWVQNLERSLAGSRDTTIRLQVRYRF